MEQRTDNGLLIRGLRHYTGHRGEEYTFQALVHPRGDNKVAWCDFYVSESNNGTAFPQGGLGFEFSPVAVSWDNLAQLWFARCYR